MDKCRGEPDGHLRLLNAKKFISAQDSQAVVADDCALLEHIRQGDEQSLMSLYDRYSSLVYSVALRVLRNSAAAEDVLQEIFIQIWFRPESFNLAEGIFSRWVAVVARNRSIDVLRKRRPADTLEGLSLASRYNLANHAEHNLMCEKARSLIAALPPEQRKAMELAFFEGMSHAEIAKATGKPLGTVKSSIRNALSGLRKSFQANVAHEAGGLAGRSIKVEQVGEAKLASHPERSA